MCFFLFRLRLPTSLCRDRIDRHPSPGGESYSCSPGQSGLWGPSGKGSSRVGWRGRRQAGWGGQSCGIPSWPVFSIRRAGGSAEGPPALLPGGWALPSEGSQPSWGTQLVPVTELGASCARRGRTLGWNGHPLRRDRAGAQSQAGAESGLGCRPVGRRSPGCFHSQEGRS